MPCVFTGALLGPNPAGGVFGSGAGCGGGVDGTIGGGVKGLPAEACANALDAHSTIASVSILFETMTCPVFSRPSANGSTDCNCFNFNSRPFRQR